MDLRQLKHFVTVCEEGSITAAARALHLTQPALSRRIKSLEEDVGTPLFERGAHSVTLTPAGGVLLAETRKLLLFSEGMLEKVRLAGMGEPLRIGYAPSLAGEFLSAAIQRFTRLHPRVRVSLNDFSSMEMRAGLCGGKLDVILAPPWSAPGEAIEWHPLREYAWRVVMPRDHRLAGKKKVSPEDLAGERLLLYEREHYHEYWELVTGFFRERQLQAKVGGEFDGISSLLAALEGGMGVALLSESIVLDAGRRKALAALPLTETPPPIPVAAGLPGERRSGQVALWFVEELKRAAKGN